MRSTFTGGHFPIPRSHKIHSKETLALRTDLIHSLRGTLNIRVSSACQAWCCDVGQCHCSCGRWSTARLSSNDHCISRQNLDRYTSSSNNYYLLLTFSVSAFQLVSYKCIVHVLNVPCCDCLPTNYAVCHSFLCWVKHRDRPTMVGNVGPTSTQIY